MPFVSQKRGFFGPYLVQMATFGISSYFWSFHHAFFRFILNLFFVPTARQTFKKTLLNPSGALTIFGLLYVYMCNHIHPATICNPAPMRPEGQPDKFRLTAEHYSLTAVI